MCVTKNIEGLQNTVPWGLEFDTPGLDWAFYRGILHYKAVFVCIRRWKQHSLYTTRRVIQSHWKLCSTHAWPSGVLWFTQERVEGWQSVKVHYALGSWQWRHRFRKSPSFHFHNDKFPSVERILRSGTCFWMVAFFTPTPRSCVNDRPSRRVSLTEKRCVYCPTVYPTT